MRKSVTLRKDRDKLVFTKDGHELMNIIVGKRISNNQISLCVETQDAELIIDRKERGDG